MSSSNSFVHCQEENWKGSIPCLITLANSSVSSPTLPPPLHVLVARNSFLHVSLEDSIRRLHAFAPVSPFSTGTLLQISEPDPGEEGSGTVSRSGSASEADSSSQGKANSTALPVCWLEDENSGIPVRWHLFAGILFDLKSNRDLPWKLTLHFTNYPTVILPFEEHSLHFIYKHSFKQALSVLTGSSKTAMNLTKASHGILWESIRTGNFSLYRQVDLAVDASRSIPVRVFWNADPPIQKKTTAEVLLGDLLQCWLPELDHPLDETTTTTVWRICGVDRPDLSLTIGDLWQCCCYPDQFLCVSVVSE